MTQAKVAEHCGDRRLGEPYDQVWAEFGQSLERLVSSYEPVVHAREDLLQEIQLALWKALSGFRHECSIRTFVYRIAHNRALTHVWQRGKLAQASEKLPEIRDPRPSPESSAIRNSQQLSLMEAIRRLPIVYRQVITMVLDEVPQPEIAAVLGITENNVAVRLNRARKLLREELGGKP